jgi:RNA-directed DNA polymerase
MEKNLYEMLDISKKDLQNILDDINSYYLSYLKNKKYGKRLIQVPQGPLKEIQKTLHRKVLTKYTISPAAHGFVKGRSPKTNAEPHLGKERIYCFDILNFFPSIHYNTVYSSLSTQNEYFRFSDEEMIYITRIVTFNGRLPQGAPTSPAISNIVMKEFDMKMMSIVRQFGHYTRYADDITISTDRKDVGRSIETLVLSNLVSYGLHSNRRKLKKYHKGIQQRVTGVVVNEKTNVPRKVWKNVRAHLHNIKKEGKCSQQESMNLRGTIEWIRSLNTQKGQKFLETYKTIVGNLEIS